MVEDRIAALEARAKTLEERVRELEGTRVGAAPWNPMAPEAPRPVWHVDAVDRAAPPGPSAAAPRFRREAPQSGPGPSQPARSLEDFVGGSVLAWLGGFAVLAGLAFLLTIAISRGWIGEGARTALAGVLSVGLLGVGVWLREHSDRTEAALAAAAVGVAGLFGTIMVAGAVYDLVPVSVALAGAFATGAAATLLATRWGAQVMGWLGLLGALLAPAALGALEQGGITFLVIAYAATAGVLIWQRWTALAWTAFAITTLEWLAWLVMTDPAAAETAVTLVAFGVLTGVLALGLDARRAATAAMVPLSGALLALAGSEYIQSDVWLVALAAAYIAAGLLATRVPRISRTGALITLGTGIGIADLALTTLTSGIWLVAAWSASSIIFAAILGARPRPATFGAAEDWAPRNSAVADAVDVVLGRSANPAADWAFAAVGLVAQLTLAIVHVLVFDAQPTALSHTATAESLVAVGAIAAVTFACSFLVDRSLRVVLDAHALAALVYGTSLAFGGVGLTVALAAEAVALTAFARRSPIAGWGAVALAGTALAHALVFLAPPSALVDGLDAPLDAAIGLAASAAGLAAAARFRPELRYGAALTLLYLASVEVVTLGGPEHTGQTLLSVLWGLAGVGTLVFGLVTDDRTLRLGALSLLALTAGKVFLYDLAALDSLYRVGSFVGFGLLLLTGAFAWQRVRPRGLQLER